MSHSEASRAELFKQRLARGGALTSGVWAAMAAPEYFSPPVAILEQVADLLQCIPLVLAATITRVSPKRIDPRTWGLFLCAWFATAVSLEGALTLLPCAELAGFLMLMTAAGAAYLPWGAGRQTLLGVWVAADYVGALLSQRYFPRGVDFGVATAAVPSLVLLGSGLLTLYLDRARAVARRAEELEREAENQCLARRREEALRRLAEQKRVAMLEAIEAERLRISRELHDGVAQRLAAASLHVSAALRALKPTPQPALLRRSLDKIEEMLRSAVEELLAVASGMRPPAMEIAGIESQIKHLAECMRSGEVEISVDAPGSLLDRGEENIHIYRIVQEALSNSLRHSGCSSVSITAEERNGGTYLKISDDGCGFDQSDPQARGTGLANMEDRARVMGGNLIVRSKPNQGTVVECFIPRARRPLQTG